jgi:hypothetical protein
MIGANLELRNILERFSEGLVKIDEKTKHVSSNQRTGEIYLPGVKTMSEPKFVEEFLTWWLSSHANDFNPPNAAEREVPYEGIPRAKCDLILSTDGSSLSNPEWAIEVKHIALVGNNGKNNDYGVAKILSPYLKDRSLIHDIERLRDFGVGKRKAVIGYCFDYSFDSCIRAAKIHPNQSEIISNIKGVCKSNDPVKGEYSAGPMIEFADEILQNRKLVKPLITKKFENAWRHPCGGTGLIFGWELI